MKYATRPTIFINQEKRGWITKKLCIDLVDDSSKSEQFEEDDGYLKDTQRNATQYAIDPSTAILNTVELEELNAMLRYFEQFFESLKSHIARMGQDLGGYDKFAFDIASTDAERCLLMIEKLFECNLRVHPTAKDRDTLTEILRDTRTFLDKTSLELDEAHEGSLQDQEKRIAMVTEAMGG